MTATTVQNVHNPHRRGTEIDSVIRLQRPHRDYAHDISFGEFVNRLQGFIDKHISSATTFYNDLNKEYEIVPIGKFANNIYLIYCNYLCFNNSRADMDRVLRLNRIRPEELMQQARQHLSALEERIKRCYLSSPAYALQIAKISAIAFPSQRKLIEGCLDSASNALQVSHHALTSNPDLIQHPQRKTWKDGVYKAFLIASYAIYLMESLYQTTNAMGYTQEQDPSFKMISRVSSYAFWLSLIYMAGQVLGKFSYRE